MNTGDTQSTPQPAPADSAAVPQIPPQPQSEPQASVASDTLPDTILALGVTPIPAPVADRPAAEPNGQPSVPSPTSTEPIVEQPQTAAGADAPSMNEPKTEISEATQPQPEPMTEIPEAIQTQSEPNSVPAVVPDPAPASPPADQSVPVPGIPPETEQGQDTPTVTPEPTQSAPTVPDSQQVIAVPETPAVPAVQITPNAPTISDNQPQVAEVATTTTGQPLPTPEPEATPEPTQPIAPTPPTVPEQPPAGGAKPSVDGHISADISGFVAAAMPAIDAAIKPPVITDVIASAQSAAPPMMHADQPAPVAPPPKKGFKLPFIAAGGFLLFAVVAGGVIMTVLNGQNTSTDIRSRAASEVYAGIQVEEKVSPSDTQQLFDFILDAVSLQPETQLQLITMSVLFTRSTTPVLGEMTEEVPDMVMEQKADASSAVCWDQVHEMEDQLYWPNSCRGQAGALICETGDMLLTPEEAQEYALWIENGRENALDCNVSVSDDGTVIPNTPPPGYFVRELYRENGIVVTTDMGDLLDFDAIDIQYSELGDSFTVTVTARPKDPTDTRKLAQLVGRVPLVRVALDKADSSMFYTATVSGGSVKGNLPGLPLGEMEFVRSL